MIKMRIILLLLIFSIFLAIPAVAYADPVGEVMQGLSCRCGCSMVLDTCRSAMEECGIASMMESTTRRLLDQGRTPDDIRAYFIRQYGEVVLAAPTKKGFNLIAWALPFIAIIVAGILVYLAIRYWVKQPELVEEPPVLEKNEKKYEERLSKELEEFE
jgi:cytochrome c-type biogenesis protein CcmH